MNRHLPRGLALACASLCTLFGLSSLSGSALAATNTATTSGVQYLIILDGSGSMSWNIKGEGTMSGMDYQCEWDSPRELTYHDGCSGVNATWRVESERRIYLAKEMINNLIDAMQPNDTMRIVTFASNMGYQANTQVLPANGWTSDHAQLKADLLTAGSYNNNSYITNGGSAQAQGILKAQDVLAAAPTAGSTSRRVAIMIADGPANIFMDGIENTARDICPTLTVSQAHNTVACQVGYSDAYQKERPITAMISAATQLKQSQKVDFYTINMGNKGNVGLVEAASTKAKALTYTSPELLAQIAARYQLFSR